MSDIVYFNLVEGLETDLSPDEFTTIVNGSSILSTFFGEGFIEFFLSDALSLRIDVGGRITLVPITEEGGISPVRVNIISDWEEPTAELIETRIHAVRQIYAIDFLTNAADGPDYIGIDFDNNTSDLEVFIDEEDKLLIRSASAGSFWVTLAVKSTTALRSLTGIAPLFFDEGRQAVVSRVRASTELKQLEVTQKTFDINLQRANAMIDLSNKIEKIKDPSFKDIMKNKLVESLGATNFYMLGQAPLEDDSNERNISSV